MNMEQRLDTTIAAAREKARQERRAQLHAAQELQVTPAEEELDTPAPAPAIESPQTSFVSTQPPPEQKVKPSADAAQSAKPSAGAKPESQNKFAPASGAPRGPGGWKTKEVVNTTPRRTRFVLSEWYQNTSTKGRMANALNRSDLQAVSYVRTLIQQCVEAAGSGGDQEGHFGELRKRIHDMGFYTFLSEPSFFDGPTRAIFPWDITADAEALWRRWNDGNFDPDLMRGVQVLKGVLQNGKKRTSYGLKKSNTKKRSPNAIGSNDLINGQWWPSRMCAVRDGAHGAGEAGIWGHFGKGAYSVVVSTGYYADRDNGETIEYCGTAGSNAEPTRHTSYLLDFYLLKQPLRVLRAVNKKSKYAPVEGIRYDGLYTITAKEILDAQTAM